MDWLKRLLIEQTLPHPERFRLGAKGAALAKSVCVWIPKALRPMLDLLPDELLAAQSIPVVSKAEEAWMAY
jgi:hypothetical protein